MLRLVKEGGAIYSQSPVNSGKVRKQGKNIVPIVFKTSASEERKEWGKWSLRSLVIKKK